MAELDRSLSQMDATTTIPTGSLLFVSVEDQESASGYSSKKITSENVGNQLLTAYSYNLLNTSAKNPIGAINELKGKEFSGIILAGGNKIVFQDASITTFSTVDIYTNVYGVNPIDVSVSNGEITITFDTLESNLGVKVVIK